MTRIVIDRLGAALLLGRLERAPLLGAPAFRRRLPRLQRRARALALGRKLSVCGLSLCRELGDLSVCSDESRPCRATAARSLAATRAASTRSDARCESRAAIIADSASAGGRVRGPSAATRAAAAASAHAAPEWFSITFWRTACMACAMSGLLPWLVFGCERSPLGWSTLHQSVQMTWGVERPLGRLADAFSVTTSSWILSTTSSSSSSVYVVSRSQSTQASIHSARRTERSRRPYCWLTVKCTPATPVAWPRPETNLFDTSFRARPLTSPAYPSLL